MTESPFLWAWESKELADVNIVFTPDNNNNSPCGSSTLLIKAHSILLASCSLYFRSRLLKLAEWKRDSYPPGYTNTKSPSSNANMGTGTSLEAHAFGGEGNQAESDGPVTPNPNGGPRGSHAALSSQSNNNGPGRVACNDTATEAPCDQPDLTLLVEHVDACDLQAAVPAFIKLLYLQQLDEDLRTKPMLLMQARTEFQPHCVLLSISHHPAHPMCSTLHMEHARSMHADACMGT